MNAYLSVAKLLAGSVMLCSALSSGCVVATTDDVNGVLEVRWTIDNAMISCANLGDGPAVTGGPDFRGAQISIQIDDAAATPYGQDCRTYNATSIYDLPRGNHRLRAFIASADGRPITTTTYWVPFYMPAGGRIVQEVNFNNLSAETTVCYNGPMAAVGRMQTPGVPPCTGFAP